MLLMPFDSSVVLMVMIFSIPIVAIVGGIASGIIHSLARQRLVELAYQERIAALQRGVEPDKLPPLPDLTRFSEEAVPGYTSPAQREKRRYQGILIGGIVGTFVGIALMIFLRVLIPAGSEGQNVWVSGLIPTAAGIALLICAALIRPRGTPRE